MSSSETAGSARRTPPFVLALLATGIGGIVALLLAVAADRVYGIARRAQPRPEPRGSARTGLIYPPGERVRHRTSEFDYSATINSLGFRGPEPGDNAVRIAAIGDSFVYGWGVGDDEHWIALLQDSLRGRLGDSRIEILNLGAPGTSPSAYASIGERAFPELQPKLVLVGILQAQDLAQLWWETQTLSERSATVSGRELPRLVYGKGRGMLARIFPNFAARLSERARSRSGQPAPPADTGSAAGVTVAVNAQAAEIERTLSREGRRRFDALSPEIRERFRRGEFNPVEIYYATRQPDYFALTSQLETPRGREVLANLAGHLRRIRESADRVGAETVVISIPHGSYSSPGMCDTYRSYGYRCDPAFFRSDAADEATRRAAQAAGIARVIEVTRPWRAVAESASAPLFFKLDGHYTRDGNALLARLLAPELAPLAAKALAAREAGADSAR